MAAAMILAAKFIIWAVVAALASAVFLVVLRNVLQVLGANQKANEFAQSSTRTDEFFDFLSYIREATAFDLFFGRTE